MKTLSAVVFIPTRIFPISPKVFHVALSILFNKEDVLFVVSLHDKLISFLASVPCLISNLRPSSIEIILLVSNASKILSTANTLPSSLVS
jgi:hypothetical protein